MWILLCGRCNNVVVSSSSSSNSVYFVYNYMKEAKDLMQLGLRLGSTRDLHSRRHLSITLDSKEIVMCLGEIRLSFELSLTLFLT